MSHPLEWRGPREQFRVVILGKDGHGNFVEYGECPKRKRAVRRGPPAPPRAGGHSRRRDCGVRVRGKAHRCDACRRRHLREGSRRRGERWRKRNPEAASAVAQALPRNAALKMAGRLDPSEADAYRFLARALRERGTRFMPGAVVVSRPVVPEPLPVRFPLPSFATNPDEAATDEEAGGRRRGEIVRSVGALVGPKLEL